VSTRNTSKVPFVSPGTRVGCSVANTSVLPSPDSATS
jgi:hypothetical protein